MTEYPSRRAAREGRGGRHALRSGRTAVGAAGVPRPAVEPRRPARSMSRIAAVASLLLAGSTVAAVPATAATADAQTVYASQLLGSARLPGSAQKLEVAAGVTGVRVEQAGYDTARAAVPAGSTAAVTVGGATNADWAALVLRDAGLPVTSNNLTVILQWMDSENSPRSWWLRNNPLNNGLGSGGGGGFGSYDSLATAAGYVAQQLDRSIFAGIAAALAADSAPSVTAEAIMASPWAGSHYGHGALWHAVDVPIVAAPPSAW